jgi:hypothetical protein
MKAPITVSNARSGRILATGAQELADRSELPEAISELMEQAREGPRYDEPMRTTTTVQEIDCEGPMSAMQLAAHWYAHAQTEARRYQRFLDYLAEYPAQWGEVNVAELRHGLAEARDEYLRDAAFWGCQHN